MTDIHAWRLNTQLVRPRPADALVNGRPPSDSLSFSTTPSDNTNRPRPRRSLASFATYLNTHRSVSSDKEHEWPTVDWSKLEDTSEAYKPNLDLMCSTLHKHILTHPFQDVPASYNSFVMHLLEGYHQCQIEKEEVEVKLKAEIESHNADSEKFHRAATFWSSETNAGLLHYTAMVPTLRAGKEDMNGLCELGSHAEVAHFSENDQRRSAKVRSNDRGTTVKARFKGPSANPIDLIMLKAYSIEVSQIPFAVTTAQYYRRTTYPEEPR